MPSDVVLTADVQAAFEAVLSAGFTPQLVKSLCQYAYSSGELSGMAAIIKTVKRVGPVIAEVQL